MNQQEGARVRGSVRAGTVRRLSSITVSLLFHGIVLVAVRHSHTRRAAKIPPVPIEMVEVLPTHVVRESGVKRESVRAAKWQGRLKGPQKKAIGLNQLTLKTGDFAALQQGSR